MRFLKSLFIFLFLVFHFAYGKIVITNVDSAFENVLLQIYKKVLSKKSSSVRIMSYENDKIVSAKALMSEAHFTFELVKISKLSSLNLTPSKANIIIIKSMLNFKEILIDLTSRKFELSGFYVIAVDKCSDIDSDEVFKAMWKRYIYNVNVLCQDNDTLAVKTFLPFQAHSCSNTTSITINHAGLESIADFFPEKLKNLYGCPLKVGTFVYPPITMREAFNNGTFRYYGSEMELIFGIADALNFSIEMTFLPTSGASGILLENGTSSGLLKQTIEGDKDVLMGFYYLTYLRAQFLSFTQSHYSIPLIIMIPFGQPLSSFEKLFRPFQNNVWIFLLITFGSGVIAIAVINCQHSRVKSFIIGDKVKYPYLNMIIVFVGGNQNILPRRNFARSLLMMFMLFCLVQRTIYQSSLYLILQSDGRNPPIATIDEMLEKNFVFYIRETLEHNIRRMNFYNK